MPKFTTKLGTTYYIKKGRLTHLAPMICCHGGPGGTHHSVKPLLKLSDQRQVVVFDQIGSGLSSNIENKLWTIETFCQNLLELINHLNYSKVVLHGSSWGGTLILEFFKRYPQYVEGLIFHSSLISEKIWRQDAKYLISKLPKKTRETIEACERVGATDSQVYKKAMEQYYLKHVCRQKPQKNVSKSKKRPNEDLYQYMWGPSEFCATGTLKNYNGIPVLKKINVPTLFISGEHDEAMPRSAKNFSKKVRDARFIMIKGASHSSLREHESRTLNHFRDFFKASVI